MGITPGAEDKTIPSEAESLVALVVQVERIADILEGARVTLSAMVETASRVSLIKGWLTRG